MAVSPSPPRASTDTVPVQAAPGPDTATGEQPRTRWPRAILALGFAGSCLLAVSAIGAGAIVVHDPVLSGTPLGWVRYGHGRQLATVAMYCGLGLLVWAWIRLGRGVRAGTVRMRAVLAAIAVWTVPLLLAPPLFSKDMYSYLAQGNLALHGFDPYRVGPAALPGVLTDNVSWVWQNTPAPYGPLFVLVAEATVAVTGTSVIGGVLLIRLFMATGLAMTVWALPRLSRHFGRRPVTALWLGAANPLVLVHLVGGGHNDLPMLGLMMLGVVLALRRRPALGIAAVTLGVAIKASAVVMLPFLVWVWAGQLSGSARSRFARALAYGLGIFVGLFAALSLLAGVGLGWIPALSSSSVIVNWLSLPSAIGQCIDGIVNLVGGLHMTFFIDLLRIIGMGVLAAVVAHQWWKARVGGPEAVRRGGIALFALAVLSPAALPWYFSWPIVLGAVLAYSGPALVAVTAFSVWMVLVTYPSGDTALYDWWYVLVTAAVAVVAAVSLVRPDPLRLSTRTPDFLAARDLAVRAPGTPRTPSPARGA